MVTTVRIVDARPFTTNTGETKEDAINTYVREQEQELGSLVSLSPCITVGGMGIAFSRIEKYFFVFRKL